MTTDFILKDATNEELGRSVEENVFAMFNSMTQVLHGEGKRDRKCDAARATADCARVGLSICSTVRQ